MSQKINPTSVRLGKQTPWNFTFQQYGKSLIQYSYFNFIYLFISFFAKKFNNQLFVQIPFLYLSPSKFLVFFNVSSLSNVEKNYLIAFKKNLLNFNFWFLKKPKFRFFLTLKSVKTAYLVTHYFNFLIVEKILFRKALLLTLGLLKQQLGMSKLIYSKFGLKKVQLKGFRLLLTGRFENSKTQMAKKLSYTIGSLSLLSLNSYIEFSTTSIKSPLGVCNLKVWLFYS